MVTESPRSRNGVIVPSRLELVKGLPSDGVKQDGTADRCRRGMDEDVVYVELDVDCDLASRQNIITPSKYDENNRLFNLSLQTLMTFSSRTLLLT